MKKELETAFDIPFHVTKNKDEYVIWPENDMEEFFEIRISMRSRVRIIIESYPQKYAADMLRDMATASDEKRKLFLEYRNVFMEKGCRVTVKINDTVTELNEWPEVWNSLYIRITKIMEPEDVFSDMATEWAVLAAGMMLALLSVVPLGEEQEGYADGQLKQTVTNHYERNPLNRELCLQANGYQCKICGFDFEEKYGTIGRHFIHVHHIEQLSLAGGAHVIDPVHDLIPVCPNCHAMLHTSKPPLRPEQLIAIIRENQH